MNTDTKRAVESILKCGFYRQGKTLGRGGWGAIPPGWDKYTLFVSGEEGEYIKAKDEYTAINAFMGLYDLDNINWEIIKTVTACTVIAQTPQVD